MTHLGWKIWVETEGTDETSVRQIVATVTRDASSDPGSLGLQLTEAKELLHQIQTHVIRDQVACADALDRSCSVCGSKRSLHDHRRRVVDTLFGRVAVKRSRWRACQCPTASDETGCRKPSRTSSLLGARATPELVRVQAELGARLSFREAGRVMALLLPCSAAASHTNVRRRVLKTAAQLQAHDNVSPHRMSRSTGGPLTVSLDGAYVRAAPGFQTRHFEILTGCVAGRDRPARHFAAAPNMPTRRSAAIGNALRAQGWLPGRGVIALSDGDPSLANAVRSAVRGPVTHILDWFHISMRVRHIEQAHAGLLASALEHKGPLNYADLDVSRLRHLIWNGYADEARRAAQLIRQMAENAVELNGRQQRLRLERHGTLARDLETYLTSNADALIDYGTRYRRGLPIASSRAESVVNSLVNARMNKRRQMRWTPLGAHHVLQVRAACIDGRLSAGRLHLTA